MLCEECREREAEVVYTHVVDDDRTVRHICLGCAEKMGLLSPLAAETGRGTMKDNDEQHEHTEDLPEPNLTCPGCGMTFSRFKERYRLGCIECYSAFRERLKPLLRRVHGSWQHVGKQPGEAGPSAGASSPAWTVELLQRRLRSAIEREEFEEAARLRDQIEELKRSAVKESENS